jgi:hypothetical protein
MGSMKGRKARLVGWLVVVAAGGSIGCGPKFKVEGALVVNGAPFEATVCHVLAPRAAGIELRDAAGNGVELLLPDAKMTAAEGLSGIPEVAYEPRSGASVRLHACGSLTLNLGAAKGGAAGRARLDCAGEGGVTVKGDVSFGGCL